MTNNDLRQIGKLLDEKLDQKLEEKLAATEKRVRTEIDKKGDEVVNVLVDFMQAHLIPLIADSANKSEIDRLDGRIDRLAESVPTIAHQLKIKKAQ